MAAWWFSVCMLQRCSLNLHQTYSNKRLQIPGIVSKPEAPGLILAHGRVGESLFNGVQARVFLSRDGGLSWKQVLCLLYSLSVFCTNINCMLTVQCLLYYVYPAVSYIQMLSIWCLLSFCPNIPIVHCLVVSTVHVYFTLSCTISPVLCVLCLPSSRFRHVFALSVHQPIIKSCERFS
jgi:hypothetical protein